MSGGDMIERVLFVAPLVHVYMIPPLSSSRGHIAANWTKPPAQEIFVNQDQHISPRLRVLERSLLSTETDVGASKIEVTILLESPDTGDLFAAGPYNNPNAVMQAADSVRFFALTVVDSGRKAVLGIGFEDRGDAFDFGVALQEARKTLQWDKPNTSGATTKTQANVNDFAGKRDWSLKDGETLHIDVPKSSVRRTQTNDVSASHTDNQAMLGNEDIGHSGFSGLLPPPPSAAEIKEERRKSREVVDEARKKELADLGFDDGEFGEFQ